MKISEMQKEAFDNSEAHGFHDGFENSNIPTKLMLIVTEVAEAMEELRDGRPLNEVRYSKRFVNDPTGELPTVSKPEGFASELADIMIRVGDLAGMLNINLESIVIQKMKYNRSRPFMHNRAL